MSEPTKEQIDEAAELCAKFCGNATVVIVAHELAHSIAHVRKQARDDALEMAKKKLESMQVIEENAVAISRYQVEHDEIIDSCIAALDALKDQPTGEPQ